MPNNRVFRSEKISDRLYRDLLNGILAGDFPPLSPLPTETSLVGEYGISRTTVRTALAQLKDEGFVVSRQGSGTIVADSKNDAATPFTPVESLADLEKCLECRIVLEPGIARIAAKKRSSEDIVFLENHIHSFKRMADVAAKQSAVDADFHLRLAKISGNKFFLYIMRSLQPHILFGMNVVKTLPEESRRCHAHMSLEEHQGITRAIIDGDGNMASELMYIHLKNSYSRVFKQN